MTTDIAARIERVRKMFDTGTTRGLQWRLDQLTAVDARDARRRLDRLGLIGGQRVVADDRVAVGELPAAVVGALTLPLVGIGALFVACYGGPGICPS